MVKYFDEPTVLILWQTPDRSYVERRNVFTVEPMVNAGSYQTILSKIDGWTVTTRDKSLSAQFEHTVGVTDSGVEIFTLSEKIYYIPHMQTSNEKLPHLCWT